MTSNPSKRDAENASSLNERLGLSFSSLSLLTRALTHRSYANEHPGGVEDNERLEFLGDAVLDFIVGEWAFNRFPEMKEGNLTRIRSSLVKNEQLAKIARRLQLGPALRLGRGEKSSGGHLRDSLLGSVFEALIGALYVDSGIDKVKQFVHPLLDQFKDSILEGVQDPKSHLQEITQSLKLGTPRYRVAQISGPDHARTYEMEVEIDGEIKGRGTGSSKNTAEREAAKDALKNL